MKHLHRNVISTGAVASALVAGAYAVLGIGFAAIVAVGLFIVGSVALAALILFEEETRQPSWRQAHESDHDHGYHPAR